ncbi:MAG: transposase [Bryobacteraceae bacterium]|jgi:REP element-mobilizing transposase RayT
MMYRRNLPHWYADGAAIFVTWRLFGTLPNSVKQVLDGRAFREADRELDRAATGPSWLSQASIAECVARSHVHLLIGPRTELHHITKWIKGTSGRGANLFLGRTGNPFWQDESFDHWVRDHWEFERICRYIENNPVSAGLVFAPEQWPNSSASRHGLEVTS